MGIAPYIRLTSLTSSACHPDQWRQLRDELRPEPLTTPGGQYALYADSECGDVSCECRHCGQSITVHVADLEEALARLGAWDATHECEVAAA